MGSVPQAWAGFLEREGENHLRSEEKISARSPDVSFFYEFIFEWLRLDPLAQKASLDRARELWRAQVVESLAEAPDQMEAKLLEGEEAFQSFYRLRKMLALPEQKAEAVDWKARALQYFQGKDFQNAFEAFRKAIAQAIPDVETLCLAGTAALHCHKFDYAEEYADQALLIDSESDRATMLKALVLFNLKDFDSALSWLQMAKRLRPESETVLHYIQKTQEEIQSLRDSHAGFNSSSDPQARRRWRRRRVRFEFIVNDHSSMLPRQLFTKSLSAGGCLVDVTNESETLPEEFNFELDLGPGMGRVYGTAQQIYSNSDEEVGLRFVELNPQDEDRINQRIISMV